MAQVIIYKTAEGDVAVVQPTASGISDSGGDIHKLARKDVPSGIKYKVMEFSDLPSGLFFSAWRVADEDLTDGVGSESHTFDEAIEEAEQCS